MLNTLTSKSDKVMYVVRKLVLLLLRHTIQIKATYILTKANCIQLPYLVHSGPDPEVLHRRLTIDPHLYHLTFGARRIKTSVQIFGVLNPLLG